MRLREADRFSDEVCRLDTVASKRFWKAPSVPRMLLSEVSAASIEAIAVRAPFAVEMSTALTAVPVAADAVVLFCGFPPLAAGDYEMMRQRGLKFVLVSGYSSSIKKFLEAQVIHLAVIPQFETPPATAKTPKTLREWFERDYLVITPETTKTLPY